MKTGLRMVSFLLYIATFFCMFGCIGPGLSDEPVGKYKHGFLDYTDVYYDKNITIDIETGKITEE